MSTGAEDATAVASPARNLLHWVGGPVRVVRGWAARSPEVAILAIIVVGLSIGLWWVQLQAYYSYQTFAQDLGAYNQAIFNTAYNHTLLYYTTQTQGKNTGALLSVHFSPILALFVPAYWVSAGPPTLILLKQFVVESAAIPLYLLVRTKMKSRVYAMIFAVGYLVAAPVMALTWTTFDPEVFLPLTILGAFYFQARRAWAGFLLFWIAALCVIESAAPLLAIYAAVGLVGEYWWQPTAETPAEQKLDRRFLLVGLIVALAGFAVSWFDLNVIYDTGGGFGSAYARHFYTLGANSIPQVPFRVVTHPDSAVQALLYDGSMKLLYLAVIFGSVGFLTLFARLRYLAPLGAWLSLVMLSSVPGWFELGNQYAGYVIPFVFAGAVDGAPRLAELLVWLRTPNPAVLPALRLRNIRRTSVLTVAGIFVVGVVVVAAASSPLLPNPVDGSANIAFGWNSIGPHAAQIDSVVALIPNGASVLTTSHLFPQVSNRLHAYLVPLGEVGFAPGRTFGGFIQQLVNKSQYILVDFQIDSVPAQTLLQFANFPNGLSAFGVEAAVAGAYLLARGWTGPPELWTPFDFTIPASALNALGSSSVRSSNVSGYSGAIYHGSGTNGTQLWNGPPSLPSGFGLPPGQYSISFTIHGITNVTGGNLSVRVQLTPVVFVPVVLVSNSAGTHYDVMLEAQTLERYNATYANITAPNASSRWTNLSVSTTVDWPIDAKLSFVAVLKSPHIASSIYGIVITQESAAIGVTAS
jgi:uncharacterized membrane protein